MEFVEEELASRKIKSFRALKGYTQEDMATKLGLSRKVYIKYENSPYSVPIEKLEPVAKVLGCRVGDFFVAY